MLPMVLRKASAANQLHLRFDAIFFILFILPLLGDELLKIFRKDFTSIPEDTAREFLEKEVTETMIYSNKYVAVIHYFVLIIFFNPDNCT